MQRSYRFDPHSIYFGSQGVVNDIVSQNAMLWNCVLSKWLGGGHKKINQPIMLWSDQIWWFLITSYKLEHEKRVRSGELPRISMRKPCQCTYGMRLQSFVMDSSTSSQAGYRWDVFLPLMDCSQPWRIQSFMIQESKKHSISGIMCSPIESIFLWVIGDRPGFPLFAPVTILSGVKLQTRAFASQVSSSSEGQPEVRIAT